MRKLKRLGLAIFLFLLGPLLVVACGKVNINSDWRTADRSPLGIAPLPAEESAPIVQVYAARAFNWRGIFAVHTWIAMKPLGADSFTVHQVLGWYERRGLPVVVSAADYPDRSWYGNQPEILLEIRGPRATPLIAKITAAVESYPYANEYTLWPGPNSNTFVAHVAREVPELRLELPTTAIGKDYLNNGKVLARAPSGTGWQLSLFGMLGLTVAAEEGIEANIMSASFGLDFSPVALKLPGIGRIGGR
ncbi:MAG: DUF3750 domain-containing protein [Gammaproteobacteria bacterium]